MSGILGKGGKSGIIGAGSQEGWQLLETKTASNVGGPDIGSATTISSTYDDYMIVGSSIRLHTAGNMLFKMTIGGALKTDAYKTVTDGIDSYGTRSTSYHSDSSYGFITGSLSANNNTYDVLDFKMYLTSPTSTVYRHKVWGIGAYTTSSGYITNRTFSARHDNTGALTKITFGGSGNMTGTFKLYGLIK